MEVWPEKLFFLRKRGIKILSVVFLTLAVPVTIAGVLWGPPDLHPLYRGKEGLTALRLRSVYNAITSYYSDFGEYPGQTIREVVKTLKSATYFGQPYYQFEPDDLVSLGCGGETWVDGWRFEIILRPATEQGSFPFELYSVGPNGLDERGLGDDVVEDLSAAPHK